MSIALAKPMGGIELDESKWKKLFGVLKKFFAKEFLWAMFTLLLALPLASITVYLFNTYAGPETQGAITEILNGNPLYAGAYIVNLAGIYFSRTVVGAIKTLTTKKTGQ